MTLASVAKSIVPVLLAGKSMITASLRSFHALVPEPIQPVLGGSLPPSLGHHEQLYINTQTSFDGQRFGF